MSKNVMPAAVDVMPQRGMRPPPPDASQKRQDSVGPDRQNMDAEVLVLLKMHAGAGCCVCIGLVRSSSSSCSGVWLVHVFLEFN